MRALIILALLLTACGGDEPAESMSEFAQGQIERIEGTSDCEQLQITFDASAGAHDSFSDEEPPDLEMMEAHTAIMSAADERMQEVGCYD